ncbi:hypothetical protein FIBSPDRAFT_866446 [Athelia psychrophila]|uniref:Uncharacterized protein n=1 Tax=Athelia psychrophila TaxID=1759441 RepID=A0A166EPU9_9AGAM|nr:hypothetical protein FIBSPDRAFT_866446 [Fibularhizoctonia sp. CBS 109695]
MAATPSRSPSAPSQRTHPTPPSKTPPRKYALPAPRPATSAPWSCVAGTSARAPAHAARNRPVPRIAHPPPPMPPPSITHDSTNCSADPDPPSLDPAHLRRRP